jgi:hypothetical protein
VHTCARPDLNSGLTTSFFSAAKYGVETACEDKPKSAGAAAKAEERRREFERAGAELIRRVVGGQRRLSTFSFLSSSSKKELLGSESRTSGAWRFFPEARLRQLRGSEFAKGIGVGARRGTGSEGTNECGGGGSGLGCGQRIEEACDLTLRRKDMGERRVRLSVDEGGAGGTGRLGRRGPRETRSRETWEPMSSNEAVTMALNSAILSGASA